MYVFAKNLNRKLPKRTGSLPYQIREAVELDSFCIQKTYEGSLDLEPEDATISGISSETGMLTEGEKDLLSNIVKSLNDTFGIHLTDDDKVDIQNIKTRLEQDEELRDVMQADR